MRLSSLLAVASVLFVVFGGLGGTIRSFAAEDESGPKLTQAYRDLFEKPESVRQTERPFIQSETQSSGKSSLETTLRLGYSEQTIPADPAAGLALEQRVRLRCYNGKMVGPTLRIRPGDSLKITIRNELPADEPDSKCEPHPAQINNPHGWNCTNLHTHGLHVSPEGIADNVFREVSPGDSFAYEYEVPRQHVSGTFWYHPHKHGSVALQVTTGLAGALIVEGGGLDEIPEIRDAFERILTIQQLVFTPDPTKVVAPQPADIYSNTTRPVTLTLINGQLHPVLRVAPGAVERWRFIHAGIRKEVRVAVIKDDDRLLAPEAERTRIQLREIAVDGIPRGKMVSRPSYLIYPGYRWDMLFKAPYERGEYFLVDEGSLAGRQINEGAPVGQVQYLAKIVVAGHPRAMKLPDADDLAACVPSQFRPVTDGEITDASGAKRICALELELTNGKHVVDKCEYDPDRIDRVAWLDTAEEWHLKGKGGGHPFHIHVNPFEHLVFDSQSQIVDRIWRDTLFLPSQDPPAPVRMRFKDFPGKTVLHCHILNHEDQGMMENLQILAAKQPLGDLRVRFLCNPEPVTQCITQPALQPMSRAPEFELPGTDGERHRLKGLPRGPVVLVFFRGLGCLHCVQQLQSFRVLEPRFRENGVTIVGISSDTEEVLSSAYARYVEVKPLPILLLADESLKTFQAFGCWNGAPQHGTFVLDSRRSVVSQRVGAQPFMDVEAVLAECLELQRNTKPD